jgi:hypothetical protein
MLQENLLSTCVLRSFLSCIFALLEEVREEDTEHHKMLFIPCHRHQCTALSCRKRLLWLETKADPVMIGRRENRAIKLHTAAIV